MYKQQLLNNIEKEMKICRRLYTKIPPDVLHYRPKEGVRSVLELLQYLSIIGTAMPDFWLGSNHADFETFFADQILISKKLEPGHFLDAMDGQIAKIRQLFDKVSDEDLYEKEVKYPWAGTEPLGEALINTSVKWLSAYKLQLFYLIKLSTDQQIGTPDAWLLTSLDQ